MWVEGWTLSAGVLVAGIQLMVSPAKFLLLDYALLKQNLTNIIKIVDGHIVTAKLNRSKDIVPALTEAYKSEL